MSKKLTDQEINQAILDRGLESFIDALFGSDTWRAFDEYEQLWIVEDKKHTGPGFGFFAIRPDGSWFRGVKPVSRQ